MKIHYLSLWNLLAFFWIFWDTPLDSDPSFIDRFSGTGSSSSSDDTGITSGTLSLEFIYCHNYTWQYIIRYKTHRRRITNNSTSFHPTSGTHFTRRVCWVYIITFQAKHYLVERTFFFSFLLITLLTILFFPILFSLSSGVSSLSLFHPFPLFCSLTISFLDLSPFSFVDKMFRGIDGHLITCMGFFKKS